MTRPTRVGVAIVGAGRMGRALAARSDGDHELLFVSRRPGRFGTPDGRDVVVGDDPAAVRGCAVVLLAVPAGEVAAALRWVAPHVGPGALVVNLATELPTSELIASEPAAAGLRIVGCKIIGQSGQIERGTAAALVVDGATEAERALLAGVLGGAGVVLGGPEALVARVNELVARRVVAAQLELVAALDELGVPAAVRDAALGNLALGIWSALAAGNTGPYLTDIVRELTGAAGGVGPAATS